MHSYERQSSAKDELGCLLEAANRLRIHGLPHEADHIEEKVTLAQGNQDSLIELRKDIMSRYLHFFEV